MDPSHSIRAPSFSADPAALGAHGFDLFHANAIAGSGALLLPRAVPGALTATALVDWGTFVGPDGIVPPGQSGLGLGYALYAKVVAGFARTDPAGPYYAQTLDVGLFAAQPDADRARAGPTAGQDDVLLATAAQPLSGMLVIDPAGACALNLTFPFALTAAGGRFLSQPVPFYNLGFLALTNTSQGFADDGGNPGTRWANPCAAIMDFNGAFTPP